MVLIYFTFYTSGLWATHTQKTGNALRIQYNNAFRALLRLPPYCSASGMFPDAHTDDYFAIMRKKVVSIMRRVLTLRIMDTTKIQDTRYKIQDTGY